ncbi:MAG: MFS transporter [Planctomycetaceae bacterium]
MHGFDPVDDKESAASPIQGSWYREMTRYHWFVLAVAALGWLFDCLDQQLFILARPQAMAELLSHLKGDPVQFKFWTSTFGDIATSVFIMGWATGGLIFGMLGDRIGRAKTMMITILMYSVCTGLSALSVSVYDFAFYRFLTGLGVGGEFAVGVALVAEVMPASARTQSLSLLQAFSAFGNVSAALINLGLGLAEGEGLPASPWRIMFCIGALPALLALFIRRRLKEPERWQQASHDGGVKKQLGSYRELFSDPLLRKHALLGLVLACSGVIGLWAVGFYTPDLIRQVQTKPLTQSVYDREIAEAQVAGDSTRVAGLNEIYALWKDGKEANVPERLNEIKVKIDAEIKQTLTTNQSFTSIAINIGAFFGMFGFGYLSQRIGRKPTFAIALLAAFFSTLVVFYTLQELWQIFVLVPIMGFCQLSLFGGYAIYFPELFPTRLRSTGVSFCYNVGRFIAALGPLVKIGLNYVFSGYPDPLRYSGMTMCSVFLLGLFVLPFLPETKGKPLPE